MARRAIALALVTFGLTLAVSCDTVRERILRKQGNDLYRRGEHEAAIGKYREILAIDPEDWEASYRVATGYLMLVHPGSTLPRDVEAVSSAAAALRRCVELAKDGNAPDRDAAERVHAFYIDLLVSTHRETEAVSYLESLVRETPGDLDRKAQLAGLLVRTGDLGRALDYYAERAETLGSDREAWYALGAVCWKQAHDNALLLSGSDREAVIDRGLSAIARALALGPDDPDALAILGLLERERAAEAATARPGGES